MYTINCKAISPAIASYCPSQSRASCLSSESACDFDSSSLVKNRITSQAWSSETPIQ